MKRISAIGPWLVFVALGACKGQSAAPALPDAEPEAAASVVAEVLDAAPSSSASDASVPPPPAVHHGLVGMFFRAADEANPTDDEKAAIDKIEDPLRADPLPRHELSAFHSDLVASIKAGRMDTAKLQADEAAVAKAFAARQDDQATALNALHQALTPDQRKAVVEALRTAQAAHDHPPAFVSTDAGASEWINHRVERMKSQLVLDLDQQKEVAAVLARNEPPSPAAIQARFDAGKKQMDALLAAFEKDAFDAKKLDLSSTPGKKPTEALEKEVKYLGQLLPILTAGQRDRLAVLIEHPRERDRGRAGGSIADPFETGGGMMR